MRTKWPPRIIYNDDSCTLRTASPPHTTDSVSYALDYLRGTQVDCLCWCVGEQLAYSWPSRVIENIYDLKDRKVPHSPGWDGGKDVMYGLHRQGIDYLPLLIEHAHQAGIAFYASFRMNDTHHKSHPDGWLAPEFWKAHPEYRLWGETAAKSYYNAGMDYSFPEVRERKLDSIEEVARNYAVDGVELDFSRTPYLFQPAKAWEKRGILTEFLVQLRKRLDAVGRRIPIMVRTIFSEKGLRHGGMDLRTWIAEGLLEVLVLTDLTNTFRTDLEPWLSLCRERGIPFYPSLDGASTYTDKRNFHGIFTNPDAPPHNYGAPADRTLILRAAAQNYSVQDISGLYLFNLPPRPIFCDPPAYLTELYDFLYRDKRYHFWQGLPLYVEALRPPQYHQTITFPVCGEDIGSPSSQVVFRFRQMAIPFPHVAKYRQPPVVRPGLLRYTLNGVDVEENTISRSKQPAGRIPSGYKLKTHETVEIHLPGAVLRNGMNTLSFSMPKRPTERDPYVYIFEFDVEIRFRQ